jgi:Kef-type K+ transport system membrane component KefB/mannitol/fructose-specific phosphotransferase system IIA component (Ntr-type)
MDTSVHYLQESHIFTFLLQILLLLGLARGLGEIFRRFSQPPFPAEILVGILLGPTILGQYWPAAHATIFPADMVQQSMLETVSWLGVFFLLLQTGLEVDFSSAWRQRGDALKIALVDIVVPMLVAFFPCLLLPDEYLVNPGQRFGFALFIATAMTISALPVAARALQDLKLLKTEMGFLIMSALSVNDIIGWLIFTLVLGFLTQDNLDLIRAAVILSTTLGFTVVCMTGGRNFANFMISYFKKTRMPEPGSSLTFIFILGLLCGTFTQWVGIHALFGFFIAGIMAGEARALSEKTRQIISQIVFAVFVPLFFANIGLKINFARNFDWPLVSFICLVGVSGRFLGAWLGAMLTRTHRENRLPIAIAHTPGGAMEIVIALLALENNLITERVFIAIVAGAVFSSIIFGPWLNWAIRRRKKVSILEFFSRRAVVPDLRAVTRDQAIRELCEQVGEEESVDAEEIAALVLKREEQLGTAFEDMLAVPHTRVPALRRPVIAFGRSLSGLDWDSPDGLPTHFIFLVLVPEHLPDIHVQILQTIAKVMGKEDSSRFMTPEKPGLWKLLEEAFTVYQVKQ